MMKHLRGQTLIEVVAALALTATAVTLLLQAHSRSLVLLKASRDRQQACQLAGDLIHQWKLSPAPDRPMIEGQFDDRPGWRWHRAAQRFHDSRALDLQEITLSVHGEGLAGEEILLCVCTWLERADAP